MPMKMKTHPKYLAHKRGAPAGNRNRLIHGRYASAMDAFRAEVRAEIRRNKMLIAAMRALLRARQASNLRSCPVEQLRPQRADQKPAQISHHRFAVAARAVAFARRLGNGAHDRL